MNKPKLTILLALILSASAASSQAQVVSLIGGIGGARLPAGGDFWGDGVRGAAIDASVSVALNDRFALEPFVTYGRRAIPYNDPRVSGGPPNARKASGASSSRSGFAPRLASTSMRSSPTGHPGITGTTRSQPATT